MSDFTKQFSDLLKNQQFGPRAGFMGNPFEKYVLEKTRENQLARDRLDQYSLAFDPEDKFNQPYLEVVNTILENDIGTTIPFNSKVPLYIDRKRSNKEADQYNKIYDSVEKWMEKDEDWKATVLSRARQDMVSSWADKLYALRKTVDSKLPEETSEDARSKIRGLTNHYFNKFVFPAIKKSGEMQTKRFEDNKLGLGAALDNTKISAVSGAETMLQTPWVGLGEDFQEEGFRKWKESLQEDLKSREQATGVSGMSFEDILLSEDSSLSDVATGLLAHAVQSTPQQIPTITGIATSLSPWGRMAKFLGYGFSVASGTLLETGSMREEMYGEYLKLKSRAKGMRSHIGTKITQEDYDLQFKLSDGRYIDAIKDDELDNMSQEAARTYGLLSAMIEAAEYGSYGIARGYSSRLSKWLKDNPAAFVPSFMKKAWKDGGVTAVGELLEETLQSLSSEYIKSIKLPQHQINVYEIIESGIIGGMFGFGIGAGTSMARSAIDGSTPIDNENAPDDTKYRVQNIEEKNRNGRTPYKTTSGVTITKDGVFATQDSGYDDALILGMHLSPGTVIDDIANSWGISEAEVSERLSAIAREPKIKMDEGVARNILKSNPELKDIFTQVDMEQLFPKKESTEQGRKTISDDEVDALFGDDPTAGQDPTNIDTFGMNLDNMDDYVDSIDRFDEADESVVDGMDSFDGSIDMIEHEMALEDTQREIAEVEGITDPSVMTPQVKKATLDKLYKKRDAIQKRIRGGTKEVAKVRKDRVNKKKKKKEEVSKERLDRALKTLKENLLKGIQESDPSADIGFLKQLSVDDLKAEAKAVLTSLADPSGTRLQKMLGAEVIKEFKGNIDTGAGETLEETPEEKSAEVTTIKERDGEEATGIEASEDLLNSIRKKPDKNIKVPDSDKDDEVTITNDRKEEIRRSGVNTTAAAFSTEHPTGDTSMDDDIELYSKKEGSLPTIEYKGKKLKKLERHFNNLWRQTKERYDWDDSYFEKWVDAISPTMDKLPYGENFRMWQEKKKNRPSFIRNIARFARIRRSRGDSFADQLMDIVDADVQRIADKEMETYNEWSEVEESGLKVKEYHKISKSFFTRYAFPVDPKKVQQLYDMVHDTLESGVDDPYNDYITRISDPSFLISRNNLTVAELLDKSQKAREDFKRLWLMLLPENTGTIHRGISGDIVQWEGKINRWENTAGDLASDKKAFFQFRPTNIDNTSLNRKPHPSVATKRMYLRHNPKGLKFSMFAKTDLVQGRYNQQVYNFLSENEIIRLWQSYLKVHDVVPITTRGEDGTLIMLQTPNYVREVVSNTELFKEYLRREVDQYDDREVALEYFGPVLSMNNMDPRETEFLKYVYSKPDGSIDYARYRRDWITRHEGLKSLFTKNYIFDTHENIAKRIKVPFTPVFTSDTLPERRSLYFDPNGKFYEELDESTGEVIRKNPLMQMIDGQMQYIGDGKTITSEIVMKEEYPEHMGTRSGAARLKTIQYYINDKGELVLLKHDEKIQSVPKGRTARIVDGNGNPIVIFRRDSNGYMNAYHPENNTDGNHIHYVATNDEAKMRYGKYAKDNVVHTMPGNSIGLIQYSDDKMKKIGMQSTQLSYFLTDSELQMELMTRYMTDESSPSSPRNMAFKLIDNSKSPQSMDTLILDLANQFIDVIPLNVEEKAMLGAGRHPEQLKYLREVLKNKLMKPMADFRTDGSHLDFDVDMSGRNGDDEIELPDNSRDRNIILSRMGKTRGDYNTYDEMLDGINEWLKTNDYWVGLTRSPLTSKRGLALYNVRELDPNLVDGFRISPKETKERHEGDNDHDTGHIVRYTNEEVKNIRPFIKKVEPLKLHEFEKDTTPLKMSHMSHGVYNMHQMTYGEMAIGEIVNITRWSGLLNQTFGDDGSFTFELDGIERTIKIRGLEDRVDAPEMIYKDKNKGYYSGSYEGMLRRYLQAALDHNKLMLLNKWGYDRIKLMKKMFYDPSNPQAEIDDRIFNVINDVYISEILKINSEVDNMESHKSGSLKFNYIFERSSIYKAYVEDRKGSLIRRHRSLFEEALSEYPDDVSREDAIVDYKQNNAFLLDVDIPIQDGTISSLQELITTSFANVLEQARVPLSQFYNVDPVDAQLAHKEAVRLLYDDLDELIDMSQSDNPKKDIADATGFATTMQNELHNMVNTIENVGTVKEPQFVDKVSAKSWDHSDQFITFYDKWSKNYESLLDSDVKRKLMTFTYLNGVLINNKLTGTKTIRKTLTTLPPVKTDGPTTMDPAIVERYYKHWNEALNTIESKDASIKERITKERPISAFKELKKRYC